MKGVTEIRWHGRAGQGTVSAAKILAQTALDAGLHAQAFPEYGPEREGAPLKAYNRVGADPIFLHCSIENPGVVAVVDSSLLKLGDFRDGTTPGTVFLVNTPDDPAEVRRKTGLDEAQIWTVDATGISLETLGRNIPNTPMLGALAKVTGLVGLDALLDNLKKEFGKKLSPEMVERNIRAVQRAYEEVRSR